MCWPCWDFLDPWEVWCYLPGARNILLKMILIRSDSLSFVLFSSQHRQFCAMPYPTTVRNLMWLKTIQTRSQFNQSYRPVLDPEKQYKSVRRPRLELSQSPSVVEAGAQPVLSFGNPNSMGQSSVNFKETLQAWWELTQLAALLCSRITLIPDTIYLLLCSFN